MNTHKMTRIAIIVACLALAGCASTGAATPIGTQPPQPPNTEVTASVPPSPTSRYRSIDELATEYVFVQATAQAQQTIIAQTPTQIPSPTSTPSPIPSRTPAPTATNYPAPAVLLSPTGPWLIFQANNYLWAINQDGTGLTRLSNEPVDAFAVKPNSSPQNGLTIAYTTLSGRYWYWNEYESTLKILSWPGGDVRTIVFKNLTEKYALGGHAAIAYRSRGLVWSPSGSKIAFVGSMDDNDATLNTFVYDTATEQITRIDANTDSHDYQLVWSADERYVIHQGFRWDPMSGLSTLDVSSARADAGGVTLLTNGEGYLEEVEYLGWLGPTEIILAIKQWGDGKDEIRTANIETGKYTTADKESFFDVAYSPEHNTFLMTQWPSAPPNTLLIFYRNGERREVTGYGIKWLEWLSAYDVFLGQTPEGQSYLISPEGALKEIPSPEWYLKWSHPVIVSPDSQWWAWHHYHKTQANVDITASELWVGPALSQPSVFLSFDSSEDYSTPDLIYSGNVIWSPDSQYLLWAARGGIWVARPPNFEAVLVAKIGATFQDAVWVQ